LNCNDLEKNGREAFIILTSSNRIAESWPVSSMEGSVCEGNSKEGGEDTRSSGITNEEWKFPMNWALSGGRSGELV